MPVSMSNGNYVQSARPITLSTPLGKDTLLAVGFHGTETLSQPFRFTIQANATRNTTIAFDALLGQHITLNLLLPAQKIRYFDGVCVRILQGESDPDFTNYSLEIVPAFWLLTKKTQSRIFQQMTVPDILKQVLTGLDVAYELPGTWEQRDYCVQYRETDFNFASRLMEEEGIYYFHRHTAGKHTLVLANTPQSHDLVPGTSRIIYKNMDEQGPSDQDYISELCKVQEQVSGKV
ncbi:MAG: type VI secretion system Vgr family protein, partial [Gemmataceae bacterium]